MDRKKLGQLRSLKKESEQIRQKIEERLKRRNPKAWGDTAGDYSTGQKRIIAIYGEADPAVDRYVALMLKKKEKIDSEVMEMEEWLETVEPARARNVLRLYYQDGKSQKEIGEELSLDRSVVSRIISGATR